LQNYFILEPIILNSQQTLNSFAENNNFDFQKEETGDKDPPTNSELENFLVKQPPNIVKVKSRNQSFKQQTLDFLLNNTISTPKYHSSNKYEFLTNAFKQRKLIQKINNI
jgi:hypothetical protein